MRSIAPEDPVVPSYMDSAKNNLLMQVGEINGNLQSYWCGKILRKLTVVLVQENLKKTYSRIGLVSSLAEEAVNNLYGSVTGWMEVQKDIAK